MPFVNPVAQCMPGFGSPSCDGFVTQTLTGTGAATLVIGATATTPTTSGIAFNVSGMPAPTSGKWHFKITNGTATLTCALVVQVTDGTNTWTVAAFPATPVGGYVDMAGEFKTDVSITAVNFIPTISGTATSVPCNAEVSLV